MMGSWASHARSGSEKMTPTMTKMIPWGEKLHEKIGFYLPRKIFANIPEDEPHRCTVSRSVHACSHRWRWPLPGSNGPPGPQLHHERERREREEREENEEREGDPKIKPSLMPIIITCLTWTLSKIRCKKIKITASPWKLRKNRVWRKIIFFIIV